MKRQFLVYAVTIYIFILFVQGARLYLAPLLFVIFTFIPKKKYKILIILMLLVFLNLTYKSIGINEGEYETQSIVKRAEFNSNKMIIYTEGKKLLILGNKIKDEGIYRLQYETIKFDNKTKESGFNEHNYYMSKGYYSKAKIKSFEYVSHYKSLRYKLLDYIFNRIDGYKEEKGIVFSMLFGAKKAMDREEINIFKGIGILHLFVVSGLHIMVISSSINKLLKLIKVSKKIRDFVSVSFVLLLVYLTGFHISALRSFIIILISKYEFYTLNKYDNIEKLSLAVLILLIINPYNALSFSFILGVLCYLAITERGIIYMYLIIAPILISMGFKYSVLYIITATVFTQIVSMLLPFLLMSVILTPIIYLLRPIMKSLHIIVNYVYGAALIKLEVFPLNIYSMIVFYSIVVLYYLSKESNELYLFYKNNKFKIVLLASVLIIASQAIYFNYISVGVHFIDVGQGDSALIITSKGKSILIDTGDKTDILSYLKNRGINKLDYVFISHFDKDHSKMLDKLDYNKLYVSHSVKSKKGFLVREGDIIQIDEYTFKIVHPREISESDNKNSMCIYVYNKDSSFLFTGDISSEELEKFKWSADLLKFPHHGSKYSLNEEKLKLMGFDTCVISYGRNSYGHPSKSVIDFLSKIGVSTYETMKYGSIHFKIR